MEFDKEIITTNFSRNAKNYDNQAHIQKICAQKLCQKLYDLVFKDISKLDLEKQPTISILDLGSGSSFVAKNFFSYPLNCQIFELDLSLEMLQCFNNNSSLKSNYFKICGDIENLPFAFQSFDLITASFSLQWLTNYSKLFKDLKKYLKKNGVLAITIPDDKSFQNLQNAPFQIAKLPHNMDIEEALVKNNFIKEFYYHEILYENYKNPIEALKNFKKIGTNYKKFNPLNQNPKYSHNNLKQARKFYLKNCQNKLHFQLDWSVSYYIYLNKL